MLSAVLRPRVVARRISIANAPLRSHSSFASRDLARPHPVLLGTSRRPTPSRHPSLLSDRVTTTHPRAFYNVSNGPAPFMRFGRGGGRSKGYGTSTSNSANGKNGNAGSTKQTSREPKAKKDSSEKASNESTQTKSKESTDSKQTQTPPPGDGGGSATPGVIGFAVLAYMFWQLTRYTDHIARGGEIDWHTFNTELLESGDVESIAVHPDHVAITMNRSEKYTAAERSGAFENGGRHVVSGGKSRYYFPVDNLEHFEKKLRMAYKELEMDVDEQYPISYHTAQGVGGEEITSILFTLAIIGLLARFMSSRMGGAGMMGGGKNNPFDFSGKFLSGARVSKSGTKFADVAGLAEAKEEVMEFVSLLKNPRKFEALGAKSPKGALLVGPPGTGKTLLAKATAGEAEVPFFSVTGSDFIEMFVGVGPKRVRDLFAKARENAPCIIFIDELDSIGRKRSNFGRNSEADNTLNQLLVEIDGFNPSKGIVVMAGTNRAEILDEALTRAGRFDRRITVDLPDIRGRKEIFLVHLAKIALADPEDAERISEKLAALTPGFSGADIANACNEAALIAARGGNDKVSFEHFEKGLDRIIGGIEKKNKVLSPTEKKTVAYHEAGHAVAGWFLEHSSPLLKVSIIPRGMGALGFAQYQPKDQYLYTKEQLLDRVCMTLAGRASESIFFGKVSSGAQDDLEKVTELSYAQITDYGMNDRLGPLCYPQSEQNQTERSFSQATARMIDEEVRTYISSAYSRTEALLREKMEPLRQVAELLLEKEVLRKEDLVAVLGPRPWHEDVTFEQLTGADNQDQQDKGGEPDRDGDGDK